MDSVRLRERLAEENPDAILWDGLDDALVGLARRCGQPTLAVYDYDWCVRVFKLQGMTEEEAEEWIEFNVAGGWLGQNTPIMLTRHQED